MITSTTTRAERQLNFVCLYTRLPGYFYKCLEALVATADHIHVHCFLYKPASEAPYMLSANQRILFRYKEDLSPEAINASVEEIKPDCMYIAGWADKVYNNIAKKYNGKIPVIVGMDNPWTGSIKQYIATVISPLFLKPVFSGIWVPGKRQYEFARRLGYRHKEILSGLYCADHTLYKAPDTKDFKTKQILFVGRLVDYKRPHWLLKAFKVITSGEKYTNWELIIIGNGPLKEKLQSQIGECRIRIIDFLQPAEIVPYFHSATVFCLPSHNEHWGVVVQEAAFAGLPMILSDTCGAAEDFLIDGFNGYVFNSENEDSLKNCLHQVMDTSDDELMKMGKASAMLAKRLTQDTWVATILSTLQTN